MTIRIFGSVFTSPQCAAAGGNSTAFLTQSVGEHLQPLNPLVFVKLQAINAVETVVLDQIQRRVHRHLAETHRVTRTSNSDTVYWLLVRHCALPGPKPSPSRSHDLPLLSTHAGSDTPRCCVEAVTELWWLDPNCSYVSFKETRKKQLLDLDSRHVHFLCVLYHHSFHCCKRAASTRRRARPLTCGDSFSSSYLQKHLHALREETQKEITTSSVKRSTLASCFDVIVVC